MHLADALAELGSFLGLGTLAFNEHGLCRVRFDDRLTVDFEADADERTLHLVGSLGVAPRGEQSEPILESLLHANFIGCGTGGAYFAIDLANGELLFTKSLPAHRLSFSALVAGVESFVNFYQGWSEKLADQPAASGSAAHQGDVSPASMRV